jgi:hypothetical protein
MPDVINELKMPGASIGRNRDPEQNVGSLNSILDR